MRVLLQAIFPHEPFNTLVRKGEVGKLMQKIMEDLKPEAAYFTEQDGKRSGLFVINLGAASDIPKVAEPFFLTFNADCHFKVAMSPEDLKNAGLEALGKKWG
jgi:hypothetical protein